MGIKNVNYEDGDKILTLDDGRVVRIVYESEGCVEVFTDEVPPRKIGDLLFNVIEEDKGAGFTRYIAKITHAFLTSIPGYTRQGIGPEAVSHFMEASGCEGLILPEHDGTTHDDGSHLTGDGPAFVEKLRSMEWSP